MKEKNVKRFKINEKYDGQAVNDAIEKGQYKRLNQLFSDMKCKTNIDTIIFAIKTENISIIRLVLKQGVVVTKGSYEVALKTKNIDIIELIKSRLPKEEDQLHNSSC